MADLFKLAGRDVRVKEAEVADTAKNALDKGDSTTTANQIVYNPF